MGAHIGAIICMALFLVVVGAIAYYEGYMDGRIDAYIEMLGVAGRTLGETDKQKGGGAK